MDDVPLSDLPAVVLYTRLGVMAHTLGIDGFQLESSRKQLTRAVNTYARVWLDAAFRRIALRTFVTQPPMLARPGKTFIELETNPDGERPNPTLLVTGARAIDDDLPLLAGVAPEVIDRLRGHLRVLGPNVDVFGQRSLPDRAHWVLGVELGPDSLGPISTLAAAVGVEPYQLAMLGALHGDLAAGGCQVRLACSLTAIMPELTVEYRDLAWDQVVTTTTRLRGSKSDGFGVLAGAFAADRAAYYEITFRRDEVAGARAAIEQGSQVS